MRRKGSLPVSFFFGFWRLRRLTIIPGLPDRAETGDGDGGELFSKLHVQRARIDISIFFLPSRFARDFTTPKGSGADRAGGSRHRGFSQSSLASIVRASHKRKRFPFKVTQFRYNLLTVSVSVRRKPFQPLTLKKTAKTKLESE